MAARSALAVAVVGIALVPAGAAEAHPQWVVDPQIYTDGPSLYGHRGSL